MIGFASERRQIGWIVVGVVVAVSAVIAGGTLSIEYFMSGFGACKTLVRTSIPSPDGSKSIVIFGKECGATVGLNTQASIAPAGGSFSPEKYPAFFVVSGTPELIATWLGDSAVAISLVPGGGKVFRNEPSVGGVKIEYR
jgi:hypothetical protein